MFLHIGDTRNVPVNDIIMILDAEVLSNKENIASKHYKTVILTDKASYLSPLACNTLRLRLENTINIFFRGCIE